MPTRTKRDDMVEIALSALSQAERGKHPQVSVAYAGVGILAILISLNHHLAQISAALGLKLEE